MMHLYIPLYLTQLFLSQAICIIVSGFTAVRVNLFSLAVCRSFIFQIPRYIQTVINLILMMIILCKATCSACVCVRARLRVWTLRGYRGRIKPNLMHLSTYLSIYGLIYLSYLCGPPLSFFPSSSSCLSPSPSTLFAVFVLWKK